MDNIIEYLVAIIFIISFLSELFGKKKNKGGEIPPTIDKDEDTVIIKDRKKDFPFEFNIPDPLGTEKPKKKRTKKNYQSFEESYKKTEELIKKKKSLIEEYENSFRTSKTIKQNSQKSHSMYTADEIEAFTKNMNNTKLNLFNHQSIRDFIIASEILNKPVALRNRCRKIL
jgi:hypothetical protein